MNVRFVASCKLPTPYAVFDMHGFEEVESGQEHVVLSLGDVSNGEPVLARTHSECLTGDALFSMRCDCGYQLELRQYCSSGCVWARKESWVRRRPHSWSLPTTRR